MKVIRKLFIALSLALVLWAFYFSYNRLTDGFNKHQIQSDLPDDARFDVAPLCDEAKAKIEKILDAPFHYIGKGCQFYAFESEDGKWVLKFLKQKHLRTFSWLKYLPAPKKIARLFEEKIERRKERMEKLFSSCTLAYQDLQEETGVLFIHLNKKPEFYKTVTLIDKLGLKHRIQIDRYEFVLQKKALSVQKVFENSDKAEILQKIQKLVDLVTLRCQKGIRDRDRSFVQNVAFCEETDAAIFVDIGQFYKDESILSVEEQTKELHKRLFNLLDWTQRKFPDYVPLVDSVVQKYTH